MAAALESSFSDVFVGLNCNIEREGRYDDPGAVVADI